MTTRIPTTEEWIARNLATAPPFTDSQVSTITMALRPAVVQLVAEARAARKARR